MYNTLLRLYKDGAVTETGLEKAVTLKWITGEEKTQIIASVSAS
ncbi:hypothetical protein CBE01nite_35710 [Clostridium beijerinckii]|uniref:XkdX family protein n=1 Tax=Clostridium beijerinckii TaxID=1520 RepID=A0AB74VHD9_CLOBE|nr:XkdX family protein [Clostridium beijerinckii]NRZ25181.1 hypothetical protein [Clostridium beijerinckii]NYB99895.1 hypothetical protein [Clostridium beijerinckii]OOM26454.1 hypothetical protein CLBEI_10480 [Clostridium beijerinckii]QUN35967.1 XkdX family protein [Clostridium beijerinckii]SQB13348.1 Uncharacterised protein [Clostridium beijerinckii]